MGAYVIPGSWICFWGGALNSKPPREAGVGVLQGTRGHVSGLLCWLGRCVLPYEGIGGGLMCGLCSLIQRYCLSPAF